MTATPSLAEKICSRDQVAEKIKLLPRPWVFTNGVFDILHRGHVNYLHAARQLGGSLIVAVNTDRSARSLGKGPDRPLNAEMDRAVVLAGLASTSLVTFFDEQTPVELIKEIKPDIYVKGGDYDMRTLEETRVVESWGGHSLAIPFVDGYSTTSLVKRIRAEPGKRKAAFLDRDGVINVDKAYVHKWEDFDFVPGAVDAMRQLREAGFVLVVITNQSGIARGIYTQDQFEALNQRMCVELEAAGAKVDAVFHCPHHPKGVVPEFAIDCQCRKPAPGMIVEAARQLKLSLPDSILIGDKPSDIEAARAAGVGRSYKVLSDNDESAAAAIGADQSFKDLSDCVRTILQQ